MRPGPWQLGYRRGIGLVADDFTKTLSSASLLARSSRCTASASARSSIEARSPARSGPAQVWPSGVSYHRRGPVYGDWSEPCSYSAAAAMRSMASAARPSILARSAGSRSAIAIPIAYAASGASLRSLACATARVKSKRAVVSSAVGATRVERRVPDDSRIGVGVEAVALADVGPDAADG